MKRVRVILAFIAVLIILTEGEENKSKQDPRLKPIKPPQLHLGKENKTKKHAFFKLKDIAMCIYKNLTGKGVTCEGCANALKNCYGACSSPEPRNAIPQEDGGTENDKDDESPGNRLRCFSCFAKHMGHCALCMTKARTTVAKCKATHWDLVQEDVRATHKTVDHMMNVLISKPRENPPIHPFELIGLGTAGKVVVKHIGKIVANGAAAIAGDAMAGAIKPGGNRESIPDPEVKGADDAGPSGDTGQMQGKKDSGYANPDYQYD